MPVSFPVEQITAQRRRRVGVVAVSIAMVLTAFLWGQTLWSGNHSLTLNYVTPLLTLAGLLLGVVRWGVNGPLFVALATTLSVGFVCTLVLPGAHGSFILVFFSAVPLFYILGGATRGRIASGVFVVLTLTLLGLRLVGVLAETNVVAPRDSLFAAIACLLLQFVLAETNEREHRHRLQALVNHQFREPNTGLPNRNALAQVVLPPGAGLLLVKFNNLAFEDSWHPGDLGRAVENLDIPGPRLYWIADDEYALLVEPGTDVQAVERALDRFPGQIVSVSAQTSPVPGSQLLIEAEMRLHLGATTWLVDPDQTLRVHERVQAVRACFQERRLEAVFQPIYDAQSGGIAVLEALTRLNLDGTVVGPEPYLGLIESLGLGRTLTEFILERAVLLGLETDYSVSLNLTYRDLADTQVMARLLEACSRFRHRANKLILELTEHVAFTDQERLRDFVARVHDAGGLVFLDDFGMGYSNYSTILGARFDAIKVAGSIVRGAPASDELRVLLSGIARFARTAGIELVAEHISDRSIYDLVRAEGIRYLQGHLLQAPIPGATILDGEFEFASTSDHELAVEVNSKAVPFRVGSSLVPSPLMAPGRSLHDD